MSRLLAPVGALVGVIAIIAGIYLQVTGAAAVVYCSVIGGGIILLLVGGGIWTARVLKDRRERSRTSVRV